jgi:hypothetical protein
VTVFADSKLWPSRARKAALRTQPRAALGGQSSLHGGKPRRGGLHEIGAGLAANHCSTGTSAVVALETAPPAQRSAFICANLYNLWIRPGDGHGYRIQLATRTTDALPLRGRRAAGAVRFCDQHQPLHRLDASASASKFRRHRCRFATSARVLLSSRNRMFALYTHGV